MTHVPADATLRESGFQHGITLVDWDGYMANPLIKFYLLPPTNASLPGAVALSANGEGCETATRI